MTTTSRHSALRKCGKTNQGKANKTIKLYSIDLHFTPNSARYYLAFSLLNKKKRLKLRRFSIIFSMIIIFF